MDWTSLFAKRVGAMGHSDVVNILKLAEQPNIISFAGGLPDPNTFLFEEAKQATEEVLAEKGRAAFGYCPTAGVTPLREWLAERMAQSGRSTRTEETIITTGGIAALDLICKVLLDPGDVVVVGEPTYLAALHVFKSYQARFVGVQLDHEGIKSDLLEEMLSMLQHESIRPKFIYTVPSFQNPAGVTMSEPRRRKLLEIARAYNVPVIEDAAYRDLRFEGTAPPLLAALDPENVIHINTFSKVFNPGVRIGWATGSADMINALILAKQGQDQCSSTIGQYLTVAFALHGLIDKQISKAIEIYRSKRDAMLRALAKHFPSAANWTKPEGGFYTWVILPEEVNTDKLLPVAIENESVAYVPGPAFYHNRSGQNRLRLCYSYVPESIIEEGVERLGQVVSAAMV